MDTVPVAERVLRVVNGKSLASSSARASSSSNQGRGLLPLNDPDGVALHDVIEDTAESRLRVGELQAGEPHHQLLLTIRASVVR